MTLIKKFAWYGSSVALAALLAVTLLVTGPASTANAATIATVSIQPDGANNPLAGSSLNNGDSLIVITLPASTAVTGVVAHRYTITMPAGTSFTSAATTPANWAATGGGGTCAVTATPTAVQVSGNIITFDITHTGACAATNTITIAAAADGLAIYPMASGTVSVSIATVAAPGTVLDSGSGLAGTVQTMTLALSASSIPADGASSTTLSISTGTTAATNADTITVQTSAGSIVAAPTAGLNAGTITALPTTSARFTLADPTTTTAATVSILAPTTAGSATVSVYITPAAGGSAQLVGTRTITFTTAGSPSATVATLTPGTPSPTTITAAGTADSTLTVTARDANGNIIPGTTVTVVTTLGLFETDGAGNCVLDANNILASGAQSCTATTDGAGVATVSLFGAGAGGTATVTFSKQGVSNTATVSIGATTVTQLAVKTQYDNNGGSNFATGEVVDSATPIASTLTGGFRVHITARDANNIGVTGAAITLTPGAGCGAITLGAVTALATAGQYSSIITGTLPAAGTACTITATTGAGATLVTQTTSYTVGGATVATLEVTAGNVAIVGSQTITVTAKDSAGRLMGDGTSVTLVVTGGALASATAQTVNGVASFTYVAPGSAQTINATAVVGSVTGSTSFTVGGATPPPAGEGAGGFTGSIAESGVSLVVFGGGTVAQLAADAAAAGVKTISVTVDGAFKVYVVGAPAFVNAGFPATLAANTPVILAK